MVTKKPPMGWNTWNTFGLRINEQLILEDFYKSGDLAQKIIETYAERCESK